MTIPTISALPTPPSRNDPTNFATRADAFVAAFPTLQAEINAFAAAVLAAAAGTNYNCTSSSSVTIGTGSKSFTASTGSLLQVGQYVIASSTASPANYMLGQVTAYNAGTGALTVNVIATGGSGTIASWTISLAIDPALALPLAGDGVVATPGIAFSSDTNTGFYRPTTDQIGIVTGGVERARVDASGVMLVGATASEASSGGTARIQSNNLVAYSANYTANDANGPIIATMKSRAGAVVQADDVVGEFRFEGYGTAGYHRAAMIRAMVDGTPGNNDMPGRLMFMTTPDGSATPSERMRIDSNGSVGIGTTSPTSKLHVAGFAQIEGGASDSFQGAILRNNYGNGTRASTSYIEARNENDIATGSVFLTHEANGSSTFVVNLTPSGARTSDRRATKFSVDVNGAYAGADNVQSLGWSANRWSVVYAGTGSINTSDERAKDDISAIPDEWLDAWGAVEWVRYKFRDAVEAKGEAARWHVGLIAQRVRDVFAEQGLDAEAIGLLCYDQWEEEREPILEEGVTGQEEFVAGHEDVVVGQEMIVVGEENTGVLGPDGTPIFRAITEARDVVEQRPIMEMRDIVVMVDTGETRVTLEAGDRWGLRYDECFAMEAAYQRRRMDRIEARLAALEAG